MKIAIIGLGYVGLPLALRFVESNVSVLGLDVDAKKVAVLNSGKSYIRHIESTQINAARDSGMLEAGSGLKAGIDFHLAFSPEREDPGRKDHSVGTIPKIM